MAGGAQLVGDILQGAFGGDDIDPHQAALAAGYTHVKTTDDNGQPLAKPSYFNPTTGDTTDDPLSKLPMKQPGFFQRAFAPYDASRANSINSSYATQPSFATQSDRVAQAIGAQRAAKVQSYLNSGSPITDTDPTTAYLATGGDTSVGGMNRTETGADEYGIGVPSAAANEALKAAQAQGVVSGNVGREAEAFGNASGPEIAANRDITGDIAGTLANKSRIKFQPQVDTLTGKQLQSDTGNADIALSTLKPRSEEAIAREDLASKLAKTQDEMAPGLQATMANQIRTGQVASEYAPAPAGPMAMHVEPNGQVTYGRTGFPSPQMAAAQAMMGGGGKEVGKSKTGVSFVQPDAPLKTFDVNGEVQPTIARPAMTPTKVTSQDDDYHTDEQGNIWSHGHIMWTAEQVKAMRMGPGQSSLDLSQ